MFTNGFLDAFRGGMAALCVLVLSLGVAFADVPEVVFEITAESGSVGATYSVLAEWGEYDPASQTWSWTMDGAVEFWSNDVFLGSLTEFQASIVGDPEVNLSFAVQAGPGNTDFYIASALLDGFDPIPGSVAQGYAHASYTLTDFDGGSATLTGIGDAGGAYLAQYNGWAGNPAGPLGTTFAEGINSMSAGFLETVTADYNHPASGFLAIGETVNDMSSLVSFTLTAQDLASGTSNYVIVVPEPGALTLLALGVVALLRRR